MLAGHCKTGQKARKYCYKTSKFVFVKTLQVNIDFKKMEKAFPEHIRKKAIKAGSTIVYMENDQLIEEDPATLKKTILIVSLKTT